MEKVALEKLTAEDFRKHLGQSVRLLGNPELEAEIWKVTDISNPLIQGRAAFSVEFRTNGEMGYFPQGILPVSHPDIGLMELFIVPLGADAQGMRYEAIFS